MPVLDALPVLLSPLRESVPIVEDAEPIEGAPVTELLLLAKLSKLPLLLRPVLLWRGDVKPQWDENKSLSLCTEKLVGWGLVGDSLFDAKLKSRGRERGLWRGTGTGIAVECPDGKVVVCVGAFVLRIASRPKSGLRMFTTLNRSGASISSF